MPDSIAWICPDHRALKVSGRIARAGRLRPQSKSMIASVRQNRVPVKFRLLKYVPARPVPLPVAGVVVALAAFEFDDAPPAFVARTRNQYVVLSARPVAL